MSAYGEAESKTDALSMGVYYFLPKPFELKKSPIYRVYRFFLAPLLGKKVVVVLPAYNAETTLRQTVSEIDREIVDEIVLVDDGSIRKQLARSHASIDARYSFSAGVGMRPTSTRSIDSSRNGSSSASFQPRSRSLARARRAPASTPIGISPPTACAESDEAAFSNAAACSRLAAAGADAGRLRG